MKKKILMGVMGISSLLYAGEGKISADIQLMNGKAGEYVYEVSNGDKISYLDWKIKNVPILKLVYDYSVGNFEFSVEGKKNISNHYRSGYMKDYDWFSTPKESDPVPYLKFDTREEAEKNAKPGDEIEEHDGTYIVVYVPKDKDRGNLSNFSKNKNYVKNIIGLDFSAKYYLKKGEKFHFAPLVGLNYNKYEFYALAGTQYNTVPDIGYVPIPGTGEKTISYKQRFITPYLGFHINYMPNSNWEILWGVKGSIFGRARAIDKHLSRGSMESLEKYKNMKYLSSSLAVKYHWNESFTLNVGVEAVKYFKNTKSTARFTPEEVTKENPISTIKNLGGVKNHNVSYSVGFEYKI